MRGDGQPRVVIGVDELEAARLLLRGVRRDRRRRARTALLQVSLADLDLVPELNRRLVEAGIAVRRLEPVQASLEERFLSITSRLADVA